MNIKKNEEYTIEITGMTTEGSGVGRVENTAVFVPNTAIGDKIRARVIKTAKNYAIGRAEAIIEPSQHRIEPDCACFFQCGGCTYRHITYEAELKIKEQRVKDAMVRIGGFSQLPVEPIKRAASRNHYRNKAQLPVGKNKNGSFITGFYAYHSHRIVPCDSCKLQPKEFDQIVKLFLQWAEEFNPQPYDEATHKGVLRHLFIRTAQHTGEIMVCLVLNGEGVKGERELAGMLKEHIDGFSTLVINVNKEKTNVILGKTCRTVFGKGYITDKLCGLTFRLSPLSFYQVNKTQTELLYSLAAEYANLNKEDVLLDLYCGTGTIGLSMANKVKQLIGVEIIPQAVENAKENAKENNIEHARFICADAAKAAQKLKKENINPSVVVVDPPRKGCTEDLINTIAQMAPNRVVYISCDCATLARDCKRFAQLGYSPKKAIPVDMFPSTPHVETIVLLSHKKDTPKIEIAMQPDGESNYTPEEKATYPNIKAYIKEKYDVNVHTSYIAQVKRMCGLDMGENYNKSKKKNPEVKQCPSEKVEYIKEALKYYKML